MAKKTIIDTKAAQRAISAYAKTLEERGEALMRVATAKLADEMKRNVRAMAPGGTAAPELNNYTDHLAVVYTPGKKAHTVLYVGQPIKAERMATESFVYLVRPVSADDKGGRALTYAVLNQFAPFTKETFPKGIPVDRAYVLARNATPAQVEAVAAKNVADAERLEAALKKEGVSGLRVAKEASFEETPVFEDIAFMVMRRELGMGMAKAQHWRPALRVVRQAAFMGRFMASSYVRGIFDPSNPSWESVGVRSEVPASKLEDTRKFQETIVRLA